MKTFRHTSACFALFTLLLTACTQPTQNPKAVADKYWQYMQTGNISEAEKLITINSRHALQDHSSRMDSITQLNNSEATTIVSTTITTIDPVSNYHHTETFNTVLVLQQGQWKVDLNNSQIPPTASTKKEEMEKLADDLSESMQENIESIDDAMNQGMQMLNETLQDGSKEMGDSLLRLMNELNNSMQQSIDKMKERREQQMQEQEKEQPQPSQPDPRKGEGMI